MIGQTECIFYSANPAYSKDISCENELWKVLVEVRVKSDSYYQRGSTYSKYSPKNGEPKMLDYRIEPKNAKKVQVISLTFVKSEFFEKAKYYSEGEFLNI